jgi:hypothetical protein
VLRLPRIHSKIPEKLILLALTVLLLATAAQAQTTNANAERKRERLQTFPLSSLVQFIFQGKAGLKASGRTIRHK